MGKSNPNYELLHQTALKAPQDSGVYLWHNDEDRVIYVGKAKNLKNRLSSYFSGQRNLKTRLLVAHAKWIEYITTRNEYEALILENNLIKKYSPRYNINLKDGKSYPVLRITKEPFPKIFKTRRILQDGSTYFGPFPDVGALDSFIESIFKLYPIRHCRTLRDRDTPCLYYHMKQCKAPCCKKIGQEEYNSYIEEIKGLLEGQGDQTVAKMTEEMKAAAKDLNFEKAARLRDGIKALMVLQNQNIVESFESDDRDYIAYASEGELVSFTVLKIRNGKLLGRENYRAESLNDDEDLIGEFMACYYEDPLTIPPNVYIPETGQAQLISDWLHKDLKTQTQISVVMSKVHMERANADGEYPFNISNQARDIAAIQMARQNAKEDIVRRLRDRGDTPAMQELKDKLGLDVMPVRIEGFDIAHIGGKWPVASLISFYNGNPDKKNYRYFRLKTTEGLIDDFASMKEAVSRRYTRLINEQADLPDLLMIDGGIGQVNAVEEVLNALGLDIPIVGLAEKNEELYRPGNSTPIVLPRRSDGLRLLQRVRDECHRFATSRNQNLRTKENTKSIFL
nr:excinuclease ABC subunit UvrC [Treponema sp.]